jgi:hypothetical protein
LITLNLLVNLELPVNRGTSDFIRYAIGSSSQTASATTHFIGNGERLDLAVPAAPNIAVIRNGTTDGILEVSELI